MQRNILITGVNKSGKTTLLRKLIGEVGGVDAARKVGFLTNEILLGGRRVGFEMETHAGHKEILAHVDFDTPHTVSKYSVDVDSLDAIVADVSDFADNDLLYVDEIGQMELFSENFKGLVSSYLDSPNVCIATISKVFEDDFIASIKNRSDVVLFEISEQDREEKVQEISQLINTLKSQHD